MSAYLRRELAGLRPTGRGAAVLAVGYLLALVLVVGVVGPHLVGGAW